MNVFAKLKQGLSRTRSRILTAVGDADGSLGEEFYERLEEAMIAADIGLDLSSELVAELREELRRSGAGSAAQAYEALKSRVASQLRVEKEPDEFPPKPWVVLVVGVNGVGKTTTIAKLAEEYSRKGKTVMLAAADTFRAGAIEQLKVWAERTGALFVSQQEGADPASVAFDALDAAKARGVDVLLVDTAGRLHSKVNLMNELEKIVRVVRKNTPHAPNETLLVIDATTGQNALRQAEAFGKSLGVTGLVVTKLDGTAKGGVAVAVARYLGVPVKKVGVGETVDDLQDFDAHRFVDAMFGELSVSD